jgi:hypothetical protein
MQYNTIIQNDGALPIPYAVKAGEHISVQSIVKDKPLHLNVQFMTGTIAGQIELRCDRSTVILSPEPDLTIKFTNVTQPIPKSA